MARSSITFLVVIFSVIGAILDDAFAASASEDLQASDLHRQPMILPLYLSSPKSSFLRRDFEGRRLQKSDPPRTRTSNARMRLYDDLLSNGYYTTRLWIGTPPQQFALIVDTGSTVTYVPCADCEQCGNHQDPRFQPNSSSTYEPVKCNMNCNCDSEGVQCIYERRYAELSSSSGVLGEDVVSFGSESPLSPQRAVFGCETMETGDLYSQRADGIMGLGRGRLSVMDQLVDKGVIGDSFSLCYGGMGVGGGAMILGGISSPPGMVFAHSDPYRSPYYNIDLKEIHVAGKPLKLSPKVFDRKHGTVLDSGTTYAYLPEEAFHAFKDAITRELHSLKQIHGPDPNYKDICFSGAGRDVTQISTFFPKVDMVFGNGQKLLLSPENYLFRHTKVSGAYCLGIFKNADATTLLGGEFQIGLITFDMMLGINKSVKLNFTELTEFIAHELEVKVSQVHLMNSKVKGNYSIIRWTIFPAESADYFSNTTAMNIILRLKEHNLQLPEKFGSYQLVELKVEPQRKRLWWKQHVWMVVVGITATLFFVLLALGTWLFWRHRRQVVSSYEPVGAAVQESVGAVVPEQELQPLHNKIFIQE